MRCGACQTENPPRARFCLECGATMARRCAACGTELPEVARFCLECGQPVAASAATPSAPAAHAPTPPATPQTYTPKHLAEKILAGRDALQGERKQVTVLFADVVGSTALIRDRDPEESQRMLDGAVQAMMAAVHRYEGTVSRLMGDGLMAMFGAPIAHEDHAVRACYAALAMLDAVRAYAEEARRAYGETVQVRVGLNSGEVIVRLISDDLHMDYTAMGPTVHLASRMEGLAEAGTALLTASTLALVEGIFEARALGPLPVKGLDEPIPVYEVVGAGAARSRLHAAAARGLTRFVGREDEQATLSRVLSRARAGQGQVVALVGEPGVGKSRLVWEVTHAAEADGWTVLQSGAASYGTAVPYLPVVDLLRAYCQIEASDSPQDMAEKVAERLRALDPALASVAPPILALLDVPTDAPTWQALDPPGRRRATLDAIVRLVLRESHERPLLLVVEDLHWLDSESQAVLDALVESVQGARVTLLVNYRPEYTHSWGNRGHYTQLRVDALGRAGAEELLVALLGDDPSVQPLMTVLTARTEGNPFFLEESVRTLVETGVLVGERGAYRVARPIETIRVPATVESVLAARIDRLPAEDKRLLQTAAVVGKDVPYPLLQAIAGTPEDGLRAGLARLQSGELLYPVSLFPELELTFKHALTHDVAYGSLLQDRRKGLHADIVRAIEALYPDRLDEHVERLAHHALRGELWEQAVAYCRQAGARASARSAYVEAGQFLKEALEALRHLPDDPSRVPLEIDLRFELRTALFNTQQKERYLEQIAAAEALAEQIGDRARLGRALTYRAHALRQFAQHRNAVEIAERARAIGIELGDPILQIGAADVGGASSFEMGAFQPAIDGLRVNLARLAELPQELLGQAVAPAANSRGYLALALAWVGDFEEAIRVGEEGIQISEAMQHDRSMRMAHYMAGLVHLLRGDLVQALPLLERAREISVKLSMANLGSITFLWHAYTLAGRFDEAIPGLEETNGIALDSGGAPCLSLWIAWQAEAYLGAGRVADAERTAIQAAEVARKTNEHGFEGEAHYRLGEVALQTEPFYAARAEGHFRDALTIAEELGMRPLQAHCHLGLGKVYRWASRPHEARSELNVAIDLYLSMEMRHWLPEAEAELAQATAALADNASV